MLNASWHGSELPPERSARTGVALTAVTLATQDTASRWNWPAEHIGVHQRTITSTGA
ncbi:hypothetical protein ACWCPF_11445 [Streptomyces sp. NPDC001858]